MIISDKIKIVFHDIINVQSSIVSFHWWWQINSETVIIFLLSHIVISAFIDKVFSIVTDLDLMTSLLSHLLKFEVFWLIRSFLTFSYFDTSCFDTWHFSTLMLFYIDLFHLCFDSCISYICMLSWAAAYAAACWSLCQFPWLSKPGGWDCCI